MDPATALAHYDHGGPERLADLTVRTGPWGDRYGEVPDGLTLERIKARAPRDRPRPDGAPDPAEILQTPSGKIELAPPYLTGRRRRAWSPDWIGPASPSCW